MHDVFGADDGSCCFGTAAEWGDRSGKACTRSSSPVQTPPLENALGVDVCDTYCGRKRRQPRVLPAQRGWILCRMESAWRHLKEMVFFSLAERQLRVTESSVDKQQQANTAPVSSPWNGFLRGRERRLLPYFPYALRSQLPNTHQQIIVLSVGATPRATARMHQKILIQELLGHQNCVLRLFPASHSGHVSPLGPRRHCPAYPRDMRPLSVLQPALGAHGQPHTTDDGAPH